MYSLHNQQIQQVMHNNVYRPTPYYAVNINNTAWKQSGKGERQCRLPEG